MIAFTNYQADFGAADNSAGTIFTANTDVDAGTGPGTVDIIHRFC